MAQVLAGRLATGRERAQVLLVPAGPKRRKLVGHGVWTRLKLD